MYSLIFKTGLHRGIQVVVEQTNLLIGRDPQCDLRITDDPEISRRHATIEDRGGKIFIRDVGSLNRILVNGEETHERELRHKDKIQLGDSIWTFKRRDPEDSSDEYVGRIRSVVFAFVAAIVMIEVMALAGTTSWRERLMNSSYYPFEIEIPEVATPPELDVAAPDVDEPVVETSEGFSSRDGEASLSVMEEPVVLSQEPEDPPATEPDVNDGEIVAVKAAVEDLQSRIDDLENSWVTGTLFSSDGDAQAPTGDALLQRAQSMLNEALLEIQKHNLKQGDDMLRRVQLLAPEFIPAYVERARLMERRGMLREAEAQWTEVLQRTVGTALYVEAVAERTRLARSAAMQNTIKQKQDKTRGSVQRLPRRFRIGSVEHQKFSQNQEYDEMRLVRVTVKPKNGERNIDSEEVRVAVIFFDRDSWHGNIAPSRATVPEDALRIEGHWEQREEKTVTAAYIIPSEFRKNEEVQYGDKRRYYGYVVRVYYRDQLQDQSGSPKSLLVDDFTLVQDSFDALLAASRSVGAK